MLSEAMLVHTICIKPTEGIPLAEQWKCWHAYLRDVVIQAILLHTICSKLADVTARGSNPTVGGQIFATILLLYWVGLFPRLPNFNVGAYSLEG